MKTIWPIFYTESTAMLWKWLSEIASLGMKLNNSELILSMIRTLRLNCFADVIKTNLSGCVKTTGQCSVSTWKVRIWCGERECFPPGPAPSLPTQLSSMHLQNGDWAPGRHTGRRQSAGTSARITVETAPDTREHCRHHNLKPEDLKRFKESDG